MMFTLKSHFYKEERDTLIKAHNIIRDMINEMQNVGLESYQDCSLEEWRAINNKIKDLVT